MLSTHRRLTLAALTVTVAATRRLVVVGLGNYTHPLTRHSVGQILLKNLAKRAASDSRFRSSGSSTLTSAKYGKHSAWTTLITLTPLSQDPPKPPLELLFVLPKALMNISGPAVVSACADFLPPLARERTPPPPPPPVVPAPPPPAADSSDPAPLAPRQQYRRPKPPPAPLKPMYRLLSLQDDLDAPPSSIKYQRGGGPRGHNGVRSLSASLPVQGGSRDFHRLWVGIGRPEERSQVARWVLAPLGRSEVEAVEFDEDRGKGGAALEKAWEEIVRVAYEEE
ncbi:hypothetical protein JCM10207_006386 [Rhodosporidiobolus poonsookiae]